MSIGTERPARHRALTRLAALVVVAGVLLACGGSPPSAEVTAGPIARPPDPTLASAALSLMERAFVGTPRQSEIRELLDETLALYGLDPTEENYGRAGSTLVALRQDAVRAGCPEWKCSEMAILTMMRATGALEDVDFREAAALASSILALG